MCGIIAYYGDKNAAEIVVDGLKKLEYRGYDSWGVAIKNSSNVFIKKQVGKISAFNDIDQLQVGRIGIGHTRWATNGSVIHKNAHPHTCCNKNFIVVHNGIVENFQELKSSMKNHSFSSETDTEIIAHLIEEQYESGLSFEDSVRSALKKLEGRFAVVALSTKSNKMIATRKGSPLVIGIKSNIDSNSNDNSKEYFVASDIPAFLDHTNDVIFLEDEDIAVINQNLKITNFDNVSQSRYPEKISWNIEEAKLQGYDHYMIKEIMEQRNTINLAISQEKDKINKIVNLINNAKNIYLIGCGTAGKVGMIGEYLFSLIAKKHMTTIFGSEFEHHHEYLNKDSLLICISQSGETADTLEAIEVAKQNNAKVVSIVNVMGSTMMRQSDEYILCNCGPEKAVCSTKATTAQISILTLLAYACVDKLDQAFDLLKFSSKQIRDYLSKDNIDVIIQLSKKLAGHQSMYIIGRSINYPIALESAIKMQEVPYIHAEGFAGGELKHGPIALIENGTPCVAFVADDDSKKEILINAMEVKSRGGFIIGISPENNKIFDYHIKVPNLKIASPIINIIPIQLLSYYTAIEKNCDPDKPRNLAKSVTVK